MTLLVTIIVPVLILLITLVLIFLDRNSIPNIGEVIIYVGVCCLILFVVTNIALNIMQSLYIPTTLDYNTCTLQREEIL